MALKLTPDQIDRLVNLITHKKSDGEAILSNIYAGYQNIVGASWMGGAATAALGKQDEFQQEWARLRNILDDLQTAIVGGKNILTNQDHDDRAKINAIAAGGMNFHRL
ncbi:WXG100 family type VII secretion target [Amycolatopsis taiwanensis]|uniref:WXG100 family type VII secretion target n=1 Tax=Amycolatopsis taiwanensis TaxID=342230 RepID=A0A9W6QXY3_9PSEU|nr:WXG100 family type VII secretion target [Amycolatopsis taiwanensis]GLY64816.1 hypothetical protein Atai01_14350 [Amycolatopsis taiwanensis]